VVGIQIANRKKGGRCVMRKMLGGVDRATNEGKYENLRGKKSLAMGERLGGNTKLKRVQGVV